MFSINRNHRFPFFTTRRGRSRRLSLTLSVAFLAVAAVPYRSLAETAADLGDRVAIDGTSFEFTEGEQIFGFNEEAGGPEEALADSQWGVNNDVGQIKITWDAQSLYVAVDGVIWGNNVILWFDITDRVPGTEVDDGLFGMTELNSWRRNFVFGNGFTPDLFLATWDTNTSPQVWIYGSPNNVSQVPVTAFTTVATFSQGSRDRSMEAAIPWSVFLGSATEERFNSDINANSFTVPAASDTILIAAAVTGGADGTGGPDSAPDNFTGHTIESADQVTVDNFAIVPIDADGDEFPDFGVEPKDRITFLQRPPVRGVRFEIGGVSLLRPYVAPERGEDLEFTFVLDPPVEDDEGLRSIELTAEVWSVSGERVRTLYFKDERSVAEARRPELDRWDGRDEDGELVPGGIYVLRLVVEDETFRSKTAFAVIR